jgi:hypothetical protein
MNRWEVRSRALVLVCLLWFLVLPELALLGGFQASHPPGIFDADGDDDAIGTRPDFALELLAPDPVVGSSPPSAACGARSSRQEGRLAVLRVRLRRSVALAPALLADPRWFVSRL